MPSKSGAARSRTRCSVATGMFYALALTAVLPAMAWAQQPPAAVLLDRLCADALRPNEEDRLFGMISLTVRATIKYQGGVFSPDLIDDSVQDGLGAMIEACPKISATDSPQRLGMAVELIRDATTKRLRDRKTGYSDKETLKATAADLSQELSSPEIDAWLNALPARERALALLLYASGMTREDMAAAVGLSPAALDIGYRSVKSDLLKFFREEWSSAPPPPIPSAPAMEYREAGQPLAGLLKPDLPPAMAARVTGISRDIYAGWSLLATVTGLPADRSLDLDAPILLAPEGAGRKRMIAVGLDEIGDPHDQTRRFLVKAYAIDADAEGAGLHDAFRLGAAGIDSPEVHRTLGNPNLAAIEITRCLWHDYGTAGDPGLCR